MRRVEPEEASAAGPSTAAPEAGYEHVTDLSHGVGHGPGVISLSDNLEVVCGPLLNYKSMDNMGSGESPIWHGSVLIVTKAGQQQPFLKLRPLGPVARGPPGSNLDGDLGLPEESTVEGVKIYADPNKAFWRFELSVPLEHYEAQWEYKIPRFHYYDDKKKAASAWNFIVPSSRDSMRMMFHSCNGFSIGTDLNVWQGPLLWKDVLRRHERRPFHVMIGGGDQIYNDQIRIDGPLKDWTAISNPHKRRTHPFPNKMRQECDDYYFDSYMKWYATEPFAAAAAQIPQINIWDDHDIIDGFGSYTDHFMKCSVFRGIGGVAFKYYLMFQHHRAPPMSTYTTDCPETMKAVHGTSGQDPRQLEHTYVLQEPSEEPSYIMGGEPGPYVEERSRSMYMRMGRRIAFAGVDARVERTRHQVNYPATYEAIFNRLEKELTAANGEIKHLVLLLGVPIAYPRLAWLENILTSPLMGPIKLLNKRFGLGGEFFNNFDGSADLVDDLDDHYTARHHKKERKELMQNLQNLAKKYSLRVTILGGDVHLAALGRFYSKPKLNIPVENDPRYITNVISSAITNKPPPVPVANLLARRNKIHHLDRDTDETLMKLFDRQPGGHEKGASYNHVTMPSRNYACITETESSSTSGNGAIPAGDDDPSAFQLPKDGHEPLHRGEVDAGTTCAAADGISGVSGAAGGLDVAIRVEIDPTDSEAKTEGYGFSSMQPTPFSVFCKRRLTVVFCLVPPLTVPPGEDADQSSRHRWRFTHHGSSRLSTATSTTTA